MDHIDHITTAEEQFAREVALNLIYLRPPKMWQSLIPGMFIFDFLRRGGVIRRYTKKYMFPRMLAMDAVRELSGGAGKESVDRRIRDRIDAELQPLQLPSPALARAYYRSVDLLTGHYSRLMRAQGVSYDERVRSAYPNAGEFERHLQQLTAAERAIDKTVAEVVGPGKSLEAELKLEADRVAECRRKQTERIFSPAG